MKKLVKYILLIAGIVLADQITKLLVVQHIQESTLIPFMPGIISFTYVKNTVGAWSMFSGQQWLFALVFAVFTVLVLWEYFKSPMPFTKLDRWCIAAIYGGALGNMIDRVRLGYVVDMIEAEFMTFPIFNVGDIFITCGCILLVIRLIFVNKEFWKDEKK